MKKLLTITSLLFATIQIFGYDKPLLDALVKKGAISPEQAQYILKDNTSIQPKQSSVQTLKIIGRVQAQYQNIDVDETINGTTTSQDSRNNFHLRRVFLGAEADLGAGWSTTIIADFCRDSSGYIEYAYVSKTIDGDFFNGEADFGYRKVNFALEEYTSNTKLLSPERSIATRYFAEGNNGRRLGVAGRHCGIFWDGKIKDIDGLKYGLSISNSYNNNPVEAPENSGDALMYCANILYAKEIYGALFELGLNFAYTNKTNTSGFSKETFGEFFGLNPYVKFKYNNLLFVGDYIGSYIDNARNTYTQSASPFGANFAVEYRFDIGEFGQLAPVFKYSYLDTDGRGVKMSDGVRNAGGTSIFDKGQSAYIGLNWYINDDNLKLQLGYEWTQLNDSPSTANNQFSTANTVRTQIQVVF